MQAGCVVRFRNRDWILLSTDQNGQLVLRPLTGTSEEAVTVLKPLVELVGAQLPSERIEPSQFPLPSVAAVADAQSLHLLGQAARLLLREGAAPFRSLGRISVRPRSYQFVPLMMALRLQPVRILIADDVGVGKTIEAGLIARELWERRQVQRLAVLCPPYLCDQWQKELTEKFHLEAVVINSATIGSLERRTPPGRTVYQHHRVQVISIDFVKHDRNKHTFLLHAPELVIIDEVHGAIPASGQERHLRYNLVQELADDSQRHLILLTATPHSGIPESFQRLMGLLSPEFATWDFSQLSDSQRIKLARHFVQRTRKDIEQRWEKVSCFPVREPIDATYTLSSSYRQLFDAVYTFCQDIVQSGLALADHRRRVRWWSALVLLRCVMSSPRAAKVALKHRRKDQAIPTAELDDDSPYLNDVYESDDHLPDDELPTTLLDQTRDDISDRQKHTLQALERMAADISEDQDNKLNRCLKLVQSLLQEGYNPVIWCHYVETAEYVAEKLERHLHSASPAVQVLCLTGRIGEEQRRLRVAEFMREATQRVLVATDCLSEGINLQRGFNAVIHYDLPWNPNRLEQREGRVDRFEQPSPVVKAVRFYGQDNPVDGAVLWVLLNKAKEIQHALGTHVPVPTDGRALVEVLVQALFIKRGVSHRQLTLDYSDDDLISGIHQRWELDLRREKQSRTRFAQYTLDPQEVQRELEATDRIFGDPNSVRQFVLATCQRLGIPIRRSSQGDDRWEITTETAALQEVPMAVRQALPNNRRASWLITFTSPTPEGVDYLGRNHPFVVALARYLFESAFADHTPGPTARCGAIRSRAVDQLTAVLLLRPRFHLEQPGHPPLLAEEVFVVGWRLATDQWLPPDQALQLLETQSDANIPLAEKRELVSLVLTKVQTILQTSDPSSPLAQLLRRRAAELEEAHRRVRQSIGQAIRGLHVLPLGNPDLIGLLVIQPLVSP